MQLSVGNDSYVNEGLFNFGFFQYLSKLLTQLNESIRKLRYKVVRFFIITILVLTIAIISPILYVIIIYWFRKFKKALLNIESHLQELSINELVELKTKLNKSFQKNSFNSNNLNEIQEEAPFFILPLVSVVNDVFRKIFKLASKIDEQIELQYKLFDEALNTDTLIGGDEKI